VERKWSSPQQEAENPHESKVVNELRLGMEILYLKRIKKPQQMAFPI
jgi:hypothetical protein